MNHYRHILGKQDFLLLWLGQGVSDLGNRVHMLALIWLVSELSGSAAGVSLLFVLMALPSISIGPIAGVLVEKWPKKMVIVMADLLRGAIALSLALRPTLPSVYVLSLAAAVITVFFRPAIKTAIPRLVEPEELVTANALSSLTTYTANLAGPALGGLLIAAFGVQGAFLLNGVSFIVSAISEIFISIPAGRAEGKSATWNTFRQDFAEGWFFVRSNLVVKFVIAFYALASLPLGIISVLKVIFIQEVLLLSPDQYGFLMTIEGIGLLLGSLAMGRWGHLPRELTAIVAGALFLGCGYLGFALSAHYWLLAISLFTVGLSATVTNIAYGTYLQRYVPDQVRSRVFAFDIAIGEMFMLVAMGIAGLIGDTLGISFAIGGAGALLVLFCLITMHTRLYHLCLQQTETGADQVAK